MGLFSFRSKGDAPENKDAVVPASAPEPAVDEKPSLRFRAYNKYLFRDLYYVGIDG